MIYLDTGILVRALLPEHPQHEECIGRINEEAVSSCHSIAEIFNTLTGFFKVPNSEASEVVEDLVLQMRFEPISRKDYLMVVKEARSRGIQGGIVYDALHAQMARRLRAEKIVTFNITNFRHVAPDIAVELP